MRRVDPPVGCLSWASSVLPLVGATLLILSVVPVSAQTRYIAFGDSITEGVGDDATEPGYPPRLQSRLVTAGRDSTVKNEGLAGETTAEGVSRIDSVLASGGDVLLLMEGTNDVSTGLSRETILFNLREIVRKAEAAGLEAVYATLIPRRPDATADAENQLTGRVAQEVRDEAGSGQYRLVDPLEVFLGTTRLFEDFYWDDQADPVGHPNAAGYDLLAGVFADVLMDVDNVPPVVTTVLPPDGREEVDPKAQIVVEIRDFGAGIDVGKSSIEVGGTTIFFAGGSQKATATWTPPEPLTGKVSVRLVAADLAATPNGVDRVISEFTIEGSSSGGGNGDVDGNGRVDGRDLVRLGIAFGSSAGDARYDPAADFDGDGLVDGSDLAVLASNFGTTGS